MERHEFLQRGVTEQTALIDRGKNGEIILKRFSEPEDKDRNIRTIIITILVNSYKASPRVKWD